MTIVTAQDALREVDERLIGGDDAKHIVKLYIKETERLRLTGLPATPDGRRAWIKYQLELRDRSLASLAREHGVTRQQPQTALHRPYPKWEAIIANAVGCPAVMLWPERYVEPGQQDPDPDCYACQGTGKIIGFGRDGQECPCLDRDEEDE